MPDTPAPAQPADSYEDIWNALQRIDSAAVFLPTFEVRHEGGIEAVTQNIVDAITALHPAPSQPDRAGAVMQQALEALRTLVDCASYGDVFQDADAWIDARVAIAALSASLEKT